MIEKKGIMRKSLLRVALATGVAASLFPTGTISPQGLAPCTGAKTRGPGLPDGVYKTTCRSCWGGCMALAHVKDGRVVKVEPNPEDKLTLGTMCATGQSATQILYHPERLKYPMKRVGARGEGKWQRISWDEAYATIAAKLNEIKDKYGPEYVVSGRGTGRGEECGYSFRIFDEFGSPNRTSPGLVCFIITQAQMQTRGVSPLFQNIGPMAYRDSKLIIYRGSNRMHYAKAGIWDAIVTNNQKMVTIDPSFDNPYSAKADIWLPVRPGSDCALWLAFLKVLIDEKLFDHSFVEQWTNAPFLVLDDPQKTQRGGGTDPGALLTEAHVAKGGKAARYMVWDKRSNGLKYWDATKGVLEWETPNLEPDLTDSHTVTLADGRKVNARPVWQLLLDQLQEWTPEKASEVTWVPADKIREVARLMGTIKPWRLVFSPLEDMHVTQNQTRSLQMFALAFTGQLSFDRADMAPEGLQGGWWKGGRSLPPPIVLPAAAHKKRIGADKYPILAEPTMMYEYIPWDSFLNAMETGKPYRPKAYIPWLTTGMWAPNQERSWKAFKQFEFIVCPDVFMTPMAAIADIVLPASMWLEDNHVAEALYSNRATVKQNVAGQLYEIKDDLDIAIELSKAMKLPNSYPWGNNAIEVAEWQLKGTGKTWEEFKQVGILEGPSLYPVALHEMGLLRTRPWYADALPPDEVFDDQKPGFATPTGKLEIYSVMLKKWGYDPINIYYEEPPESPYRTPDLYQKYPLVLTTGRRMPVYFHSEHRMVPWLRELFPAPLLDINPDTAAKLGIADGDWVWIETPRGRMRHVAHLTNGIDPRVVMAYQHNFWYPEKPETPDNPKGLMDSNVNILTDSSVTNPITGALPMKGLLCKVYKAAEGAPPGVWTKPEQLKAWLPEQSGGYS
ncbi:MAG TPA: molybdopterin-dependent oxidoreductase [Syntrophales bacterium]|nr:molybdopterin-dependent oxidoreductase [Syntrophales bacterium]